MELVRLHKYSALMRNTNGKNVRFHIREIPEYQVYSVTYAGKTVYIPEVNKESLENAFIEPKINITYDLKPTKQELLPLPKSAAITPTVVVDNYFKVNKDAVKDLVKEITGRNNVKFIEDFITGNDLVKGLKGVRYHSKFGTVVIIAQHDCTDQIKHYLSKGTKVYVLDVGMNTVFELPKLNLRVPTLKEQMSKTKMFKINEHNRCLIDEIVRVKLVDYHQYHQERRAEFRLESFLEFNRQNHSGLDIPRNKLEELADTWSAALGYKFSSTPSDKQFQIDDFEPLTFEILPYAGVTHYYFKGYLCESKEPDGKKEIKISHKAILKKRLGVPTEELVQFYKFYQEILDNDLLFECLEYGWELCYQCKRPVYIGHIEIYDQNNPPYCKFCGDTINENRYYFIGSIKPYVEVALTSIEEEYFRGSDDPEEFEELE
jgi:hypothetical protein